MYCPAKFFAERQKEISLHLLLLRLLFEQMSEFFFDRQYTTQHVVRMISIK